MRVMAKNLVAPLYLVSRQTLWRSTNLILCYVMFITGVQGHHDLTASLKFTRRILYTNIRVLFKLLIDSSYANFTILCIYAEALDRPHDRLHMYLVCNTNKLCLQVVRLRRLV